MADIKKSVNLLPEYLRTDKNAKFLSSTIDQLIQTPQLERIDGYVGSKSSPNYKPAIDTYLKEHLPLRKSYQLEPALVFKDSISNITDVVGYDDLINDLSIQGANVDNLDKLFRTDFYSYNPLIEWDKLVNYNRYYWLPEGPDPIEIDNATFNIADDIVGQLTYEMPNGYALSNGMKLVFTTTANGVVEGAHYIVEGVGKSITLVKFENLEVGELLAVAKNETFDSELFDSYPFDSDGRLPIIPEYITINRSSKDLNPWSRYNRWFHEDIVHTTAAINGTQALLLVTAKAKRPIVEFKPNIQLYNFGVTGIQNVDYIDTSTTDAFTQVHGTYGYHVDGRLLEHGQRVIFNADLDENVKGKIYEVQYTSGASPILQLVEALVPNDTDSTSINLGTTYSGTSWHYHADTKTWMLSQQHTKLNEAPLFDLFNNEGVSYKQPPGINNFQGTKVFGYEIGTGTVDNVLGFPLKYQNTVGVGSFLFRNYFMTDTVSITINNVSSTIGTGTGFLRINEEDGLNSLVNVWVDTVPYQIPVIETQTVSESTSALPITSLNSADPLVSVISYVNGRKVSSTVNPTTMTVTFESPLVENDAVQFKIITDQVPNSNGYYEPPLGLTNNPLNGPIATMTLSELTDHLTTMISKLDTYVETLPGYTNLRDLDDYAKYGTRFIISANPISFAKLFLGKKEHNVVDSIRYVAEQYSQFKLNLLRTIVNVSDHLSPADALDEALKLINKNKDKKSPYYRSDMLAYGIDKSVKEYTVGSIPNYVYPLGSDFVDNKLSLTSVLFYLNGVQLTAGVDYTIDNVDSTVTIIPTLVAGDIVKVCVYNDTSGCFVPPTPSKLGLYPKFAPAIITDDSYVSGPVSLIRCHDGSVVKTYGDYRDAIVLEYENRIYNNIKSTYNSNIFDVASVMPGAFRNDKYSLQDANSILRKDFIRWAGAYNVDATTNSAFDDVDPFTWNFKGSVDKVFGNEIRGNWRAIYNYFYDTDRPHTHPWEMLGLSEKPTWWDTTYGTAPYTSGDTLMWADLRDGYIRGLDVYNSLYSRPDLLTYIPVDALGNLKSPDTFLVSLNAYRDQQANWEFGDQGPAETAWRRSSYYPYAINALAALLDPTRYTAWMYDISRTSFNTLGQLTYGDNLYLNPANIVLDNVEQIAGYGVFVAEHGKQKDLHYLTKLLQDISYIDFNLFHKLGGFASKEKLQIIIDSVDPTSIGQSAVLPPEDYSLILNTSNPVKSASISGIIVQKSNGKFLVRGYDRVNPYFEILAPIKTSASGAVTVGGVSSPFTEWSGTVNNGTSGVGAAELTSAESNTTRYYKQGQIVRYNNRYYIVKVGHTAQSTFDTNMFQSLPSLPMVGGSSAQLPARYETVITQIPYGTEYTSIQEVYDLIVGYGAFLESQGFIFDQLNSDLGDILNWKFTGKEFLYWTTQNWADNNLITLSPFADTLRYQYIDSIVDNVLGDYEYSLLKADGRSFPIGNFNLTREDGVCTIKTLGTEEGIFFATLNSIQKEHAMVLNNTTMFNDKIYDIETGYRQKRIKLSGFRTANWNGDLFSPGFIYDNVSVTDWESFKIYNPGKVVRYNGAYYESTTKINGDATFDFNKWTRLSGKPTPSLLPNFDYKIGQIEDFYSLDIDNFDADRQALSQHLIGYTERPYLTNIFPNQTSQYKFYQGLIREKGTRNAINKISKASVATNKGSIDFKEEWAFRIGNFGAFASYKEIEFPLEESNALENPYLVKFSDTPQPYASGLINYTSSTSMLIAPENYVPGQTFEVYPSTDYEDTNLKLMTAGYVRTDDVTATAYNKNSLLDIANNSTINENDTIWTGFLENGDWTVYRYTRQQAKIAGVYVSAPGTAITFTTDYHHGLSVGDVISVVAFNGQVDGVYLVNEIPELYQFTVNAAVFTIENEELLAFGSLYKFEEARFSNFEELAANRDLIKLSYDDKVWIDRASDKWAVYQKINNYTPGEMFNSPAIPLAQQLGHTIHATDDSSVVIVSAPTWNLSSYNSIGRLWVLDKTNDRLEKRYEYILNSDNKTYCDPDGPTAFGYSLNYDQGKGLYFAGAPEASYLRLEAPATVVYTRGSGTASTRASEGLVKISSRDPVIQEEKTERVLTLPTAYAAANARFGHSVYINQVSSTETTTLLVGAPCDGVVNTGAGNVFAYHLTTSTSLTDTVTIVEHPEGILLSPHSGTNASMQWGHKIAGNTDGSIIAISAPGFVSGATTGIVEIFNSSLEWQQTITSPFNAGARFGDDIFVSTTGNYLFVSSERAKNAIGGFGKVAVYVYADGEYTLHQIIDNPVGALDLRLGHSVSLSKDEQTLVISALGKNRSQFSLFDNNTRYGETTFDQDSTRFLTPVEDAGTVYVYNNLGGYFVLADELINVDIVQGSTYGHAVAATNNTVFVGAPWFDPASTTDESTFFQFTKLDSTLSSFNLLRSQPDLVEVDTAKRVVLINSIKEEITEYLDVIDPLKGKIAGIADQELKFRSAADPATYSIGLAGVVVDTETNWIDDHVGDLWWDLSTAKYVWYEQGEELYRKNSWGKLFPGATIDVYEWVKSDLLPSEWAIQADTVQGLTLGISGQPKFPDNSIISVKQVFNNVTHSFENVYYYWVKNKVTVPDIKNRRISSYQVANVIADPVANGVKFIELLGPDSIALANIQSSLVSNNINLSIATDAIRNTIPRHTEWLLLEEGKSTSMPTTLLNKKLFDSLLGHDSSGLMVPDPSLSYRSKYGIGIRPQQTLFKNRLEALRNLVEFTNNVLIANKITGNYNFSNLDKKEDIPDEFTREFDVIVEDLDELALVETVNLSQAKLECYTFNGKVVGVSVIESGFGYTLPPQVTISSATGSGAVILTTIDSLGRVVDATVTVEGDGYADQPTATVRPHTVVVTANSEYGNRWTKHAYDYRFGTWVRVKTQTFNTALYWHYVDWVDSTYNKFKDYSYVINDPFELATISNINTGDYVKVKNIGDGRYVILERVAADQVGDFSVSYKIVYSQNGTVQISDSIWDYSASSFAYDVGTLEETLYDQIPDQELLYILTALKDDIFIKDLRVYWNLFFFSAVKYALTEQKLLDWAFKTSFINVKNVIGTLDQPSVYRLDNEKYFEEYIKEVKPYRTKIRTYTSSYTGLDEGRVYTTDFDLPSYYNSATNAFEVVGLTNDLITQTPRNDWYNNYKYYIGSIEVGNQGAGYTQRPTVTITTATGDTGTGATAEAYIRNGQLFKVLVTNPGEGYILPPAITITGGGASVTSTATAFARIANDPIRKNLVGIKFDRVGIDDELGDSRVTEQFVCPGNTGEFVLSWLAEPEKGNITPLIDGKLILATDYKLVYYTERYNNYTKEFSKFIFLNQIPSEGQIFKITYNKNINLYTAVDRINRYYAPTDSMPGIELPLLMSGAEFGGTTVQGLTFDHSPVWGNGLYDNNSVWEDIVDYYASAKLVNDVVYCGNTMMLDSVKGISPGHRVSLGNTSTNYIRRDTVVTSVNTVTNSITLSDQTYSIKRIEASTRSAADPITFYTKEKFNTYIQVGDFVEVTGVAVPEYNGSYIVTGSGNDRFAAIGRGGHSTTALSTGSVRSLSSAFAQIPSVRADINLDSTYKTHYFEELIESSPHPDFVVFDTKIPFSNVAYVDVYDASRDMNVPKVTTYTTDDHYISSESETGTFQLSIHLADAAFVHISVYSYPTVEFWKDAFSKSDIDTEISAGSWNSAGNMVGGLGVNPTDLTIDGRSFLDPKLGYAPEEHVKGQTFDTVSINVFEQDLQPSALAVSGIVSIPWNTQVTVKLGVRLDESVGIMVTFNSENLNRVAPKSTGWPSSGFKEFYVEGDILTIAPQNNAGRVTYTILSMGGNYLLDSSTEVIHNQSEILITSAVNIDEVRSVYVTVDGAPINETTTSTNYGYMLTTSGVKNKRAAIVVYDIPSGVHTIQAWFMAANHPKINRMSEQTFNITSATSILSLEFPPGVIEPVSSQVIVEAGVPGQPTNRKRLSPPYVSYYKIQGSQVTFDIDNKNYRPFNSYTMETVRVYGNGTLLRPGFDYDLDEFYNKITLISGVLGHGSVLAIEGLIDYDYIIVGDSLYLSSPISNNSVKVITFTDHDNMLLRTDRFQGNPSRRYVLSLPAISNDYIWVTINGVPMTAGSDYELLDDLITVQFNEWVYSGGGDDVLITTINSPNRSHPTIGYRMFKDMFNREYYMRQTDFYSTRLSQPLTLTDTEIHVYDSTRLIPPNLYKNKPGVVFIDSERIEFFEKAGNVLSNLRRGTHGTAAAKFSEIGTFVQDQSPQQYMTGGDIVYKQTHLTTSSVSSHVLSTATNNYVFVLDHLDHTVDIGNYQFKNDGLQLDTSVALRPDGTTTATNQVLVSYGGRPLRKKSIQVHDPKKAYDTTSTSLVTLDPEFAVIYNTDTGKHELQLNIEGFTTNVRLDIQQKVGQSWTTGTETLINSDCIQSRFLRDKPTQLPDSYYYGGNPVLTDENNFELTDNNDDPIQGY